MTTVRNPIPKHIEKCADDSGTPFYKCTICPKGSYFKTRKHISYHHRRDCLKKRRKALAKEKKKKTTAGSGPTFLCTTPTCGKQFNRKDNLERHEKIHARQGNGTPYKCNLENDLERHGVTHTDFKCILCAKKFPKEGKDNYERHLHLEHRGDDKDCKDLANNGGILLRNDVPKNTESLPRTQMAEVATGRYPSDGSVMELRKEGEVAAAATYVMLPLHTRKLDGRLLWPGFMVETGTLKPDGVGELLKVASEKEGETKKDEEGKASDSKGYSGDDGIPDSTCKDHAEGNAENGEGDNNKKGEAINKSAWGNCNIM